MAPRPAGTLALIALSTCFAAAQKKPLDHSVYDGWKALGAPVFTRDGKYVAYSINPQEGDGVVTVRRLADGASLDIARGSGLRFSQDGKWFLTTQIPPLAETKKARRDKKKPEDQPKNNLVVVDLAAWKPQTIERVATWQMAPKDLGWILYRLEPAPKPAAPPATPPAASPPVAPAAKPEEAKKDDAPKKKADHKAGESWILKKLGTEGQETLESVSSTAWSEDGSTLLVALSTADGKGDGVTLLKPEEKKKTPVVTALGRYTRLTLTRNGSAAAFTTDKDDYAAKKPKTSLYVWNGSLKKIEPARNSFKGEIASTGSVSFSESGKRLMYGTATVQPEEKEVPDDEKVSLDVWNWKDPLLQPQQLLQAASERNRNYLAVYSLDSGANAQLETPERPDMSIGSKGDASVALASNGLLYRPLVSWDGDYQDIEIVDVRSGNARKVVEKLRGRATLTPDAKTLVVFDEAARKLYTVDTRSLDRVDHALPTPLFDEEDDHPDTPGAYGVAGWTKDGKALIYDRYDIWLVDLTGKAAPKNLTNARSIKLICRVHDMDSEADYTDPDALWLDVRDETTQRQGIYRRTARGLQTVKGLAPKSFPYLAKAKDAEVYAYRQGSVEEYPELWIADANLNGQKITETNPQQKDYNWLTAELVTWRSADGEELQGIVYKPQNFDPTKKYPMIAYFYERDAATVFNYRAPAPSASTINIPLFVSQGYIVFDPDIKYKVGYPGESAMSAIVSGVNSIVEKGYVDPKRLGIQGQSWGGYQVAYLVTETNMFAAAGSGAPVSDMFSAYGGIRYGSGLVRQFQYEKQQSRIGGTPWDSTLQYIENSPLFHLPKVQTPILIMSNDKDGAVPHTQGIELFTGLRRLNKPAWMLVYNDEDHNLVQRKNRKDLSIRLSQFFDYYLKDGPLPVWMDTGVPAVDKGRTMGTEIAKPKN